MDSCSIFARRAGLHGKKSDSFSLAATVAMLIVTARISHSAAQHVLIVQPESPRVLVVSLRDVFCTVPIDSDTR